MRSYLAAGLALATAATSCGYSAGYDLQQEGIRTVAVEVVDNATLRQRFEIPLTEEIQRALPIHAGLQAAPRRQADAILVVELQSIDGRSLVQGNVDVDPVREGALLFTVRAVLTDRRSGRVLRDCVLRDRAEFRTPIGETERSAQRESAFDMARKIALALEADF